MTGETNVRRSASLVLGILLLGLLIYVLEPGQSTSTYPIVQTPRPAPLRRVQAQELFAAYDQNELRADSVFKGQRVAIEGVVESVGRDILNSPYVTLKSSAGGISSVQCMFQREQEPILAQLHSGQPITVNGIVDGKMINIIVRNCGIGL